MAKHIHICIQNKTKKTDYIAKEEKETSRRVYANISSTVKICACILDINIA